MTPGLSPGVFDRDPAMAAMPVPQLDALAMARPRRAPR